MTAAIARYYIPTNTTHWIAHRRRVYAQLEEWGYDWKNISTQGLSREEGYREFVPVGEIINPNSARVQGNRFFRMRTWKSKEDWDWMLENCPMVLANDFEDEETE